MKYERRIMINKKQGDAINKYLHEEPTCESECLYEDVTITDTVVFDNGMEMDIKCCGVQYEEGASNLAWTEAVLFNGFGREVACSEPSDEYFGEWVLEYEGNQYVAIVEAEKEITKENFTQSNRDKKIGHSQYRICQNEKGKWYILETYNDGVEWIMTRGCYSDDLQDVIDKINSFKTEKEIAKMKMKE